MLNVDSRTGTRFLWKGEGTRKQHTISMKEVRMDKNQTAIKMNRLARTNIIKVQKEHTQVIYLP